MAKLSKKQLDALIDQGCNCKQEETSAKLGLKEVKAKLADLPVGKYITGNSNILIITENDKFGDIDPNEAKVALRAKRLGKHFISCIKVNVTSLRKWLSDTELNTLRKKVGVTRVFSFK